MSKTVSVGLDKILYDVIFDSCDDIYGFCDVLADYMIDKYTNIIISGVINRKYKYLTKDEMSEIANSVSEYGAIMDKEVLCKRLVDYIAECDKLVLTGFVTFRMKDYIQKIESAVDDAVEQLLIRYEYEEFTELLKFFVDIQNPVTSTVYVISCNGKYILLDDEFKEIANEYMNDLRREMRYGKIDYDDLLLSTLITLAPANVYIFNYESISNRKLIETLKKVFANKLTLCGSIESSIYAQKLESAVKCCKMHI